MNETNSPVTFSFGENWQDYSKTVTEAEIEKAKAELLEFLDAETVAGARVLDIGSGSGLHSLGFVRLGAAEVHSFDYDVNSVEATRRMRQRAGEPENWTVERGSVLDADYLAGLGSFDIVYSWGVLHHTGDMWRAIDNASGLVRPGGTFWITLYVKGPRYPRHLALKQRYNRASPFGKKFMVWRHIFRRMLVRLRHFRNPFAWNEKKKRGMNVYHDIIDWYGGLPYEVADADEVLRFGIKRGFALQRILTKSEGACSYYVFKRAG